MYTSRDMCAVVRDITVLCGEGHNTGNGGVYTTRIVVRDTTVNREGGAAYNRKWR